MGGAGLMPKAEDLARARAQVGMQHVHLDERRGTVQFARDGMMIDLGSIGKGYALELAVEILREAGVESGLLHGGTSTICAFGTPPQGPWKVAVEAPPRFPAGPEGIQPEHGEGKGNRPLAVVELQDTSLSVSGVHGKCFRAGEKVYGHVIDPRSGEPAQSALLAAVALPSATETDAFSTALLLGGMAGQAEIAALRPGMRTLVVGRDPASGETAAGG